MSKKRQKNVKPGFSISVIVESRMEVVITYHFIGTVCWWVQGKAVGLSFQLQFDGVDFLSSDARGSQQCHPPVTWGSSILLYREEECVGRCVKGRMVILF